MTSIKQILEISQSKEYLEMEQKWKDTREQVEQQVKKYSKKKCPEVYACVTCIVSCSKVMCLKCENKQLKSVNEQLQQQLNFILSLSSDKLKLNIYQKQEISKYMIRQSEAIQFTNPIEELPKWHFVTVTFDPAKFGLSNNEDEEKNYILHEIIKLFRKGMIKSVYGCFEYTKALKIHAHFVCYVYDNDYKPQLKKAFTDNPKNNRAIDTVPAKFPNVITYINKESTDYFKLKD